MGNRKKEILWGEEKKRRVAGGGAANGQVEVLARLICRQRHHSLANIVDNAPQPITESYPKILIFLMITGNRSWMPPPIRSWMTPPIRSWMTSPTRNWMASPTRSWMA